MDRQPILFNPFPQEISMSRLFTAVLLFLSVSVVSAQETKDWNQWKGPKSDNHSFCTGLIDSIPEGGPKLLWQVDTLGGGFSNLCFSGDQIFTLGDFGDKCFVLALDRKTGKENWRTPIGRSGGNAGHNGPFGTPACDGETVYVMSQFAEFAALDVKNGNIRWQKNTERELGGRRMAGWSFSMSPLLDGDKIILPIGGDGGTLAAFDKSGNLLWRSEELKDAAAYTSAVPVEIGGVRQYLLLTGQSIVAISAADGKILWGANFPGRTAVCSDPVLVGDVVMASCGYGVGAVFYRITKEGDTFKAFDFNGDQSLQSHHGGIVAVGDHCYFMSNSRRIICVEAKTGKMVWENQGVGKGSMLYADGKLFLRSESGDGTVAMIEATPTGYKELGRFDQPDRSDKSSWTYPLIVDGKLFLRDQGLLLCYDVKK